MRTLIAAVLIAGLLVACGGADNTTGQASDDDVELEGLDEVDKTLQELEDLDRELSLDEDIENLNLTVE